MAERGAPHSSNDDENDRLMNGEVAGDDSLVAKGFWRSVIVVSALVVLAIAFIFFRSAPRSTPGSTTPSATPLSSPSKTVEQPSAVAFRDVALAAGVDFVHESGARGGKLLPECLGGGVAIVDLDGDGLSDLVFTQGQPLDVQPLDGQPNGASVADPAAKRGGIRVYRNRTIAGGELSFEHIVALDHAIDNCNATGLAIGDINADGRTDLYVASVDRDRLLLNTTTTVGAITFTDATDSWGIPDEHEWGTSAGMFDADNDGDLDILVANYVQWTREIDCSVNYTLDGIGRAYGPPTGFEGSFVTLLQNNGATLRDVTSLSGVDVRNPVTDAPYAKALGLMFVDVNRDGLVDVLVANDRTPKFLLQNLGPRADGIAQFRDVASNAGFAYDRDGNSTGAMGIDATWLRDGTELAIAVGNFANEPSSLYVQPSGETGFSDEALGQGYGAPTRSVLTFGTLFVDVDLDGDEDIVQANGHLEPDINRVAPSQHYAQRGQLFINRGGDSVPLFVEADPALIGDLATPTVGRGLASGDLDGDGDPDLVIVNLGGAARVLRNEQRSGNAWIKVSPSAADASAQPSAGAEVEVMWLIDDGAGAPTQRLVRRIMSPTRSYLSQCADEVIVGLGKNAASSVQVVELKLGSRVWLRATDAPVNTTLKTSGP